MYTAIDTRTTLSLARQHQDDVRRSFPRKWRKPAQASSARMSPPTRIDAGALAIPAPRDHAKESTAA